MTKFDIGGSQGSHQPGSNDLVLANKPGITDIDDMQEAELVLLGKLYEEVLLNNLPQNSISVAEIKTWHRRWLGNVYEWAGNERSVNMSKGDFPFAAAGQISQLLNKFEQNCLNSHTPCFGMNNDSLIEAIAVTHIEFVLIHPFRDGNGRLSRFLADVMAVQGESQPLDYTSWDQNKNAYFAAIQQGMAMNYEPIKSLIKQAIEA